MFFSQYSGFDSGKNIRSSVFIPQNIYSINFLKQCDLVYIYYIANVNNSKYYIRRYLNN